MMAKTKPEIETMEADLERECGIIAENEQKIKLFVAEIDALDNELNSADPSLGVMCETERELQKMDNKFKQSLRDIIRKIPKAAEAKFNV